MLLWTRYLRPFFFAPIDARGFGLMRIVWAATALVFYLLEAPDIIRYYSEAGLLPAGLEEETLQRGIRLTIFSFVRSPTWVLEIYVLFLLCLVCMLIGKWTRVSTVLSVLLLMSFNERNTLPAAGGETVLRLTGYILMLAPNIHSFSVDRLRGQWQQWQRTRQFLPQLTMPVWPWRLLLWQLLIIYGMSVTDKLGGYAWRSGQAIHLVLQSTHFVRFDPAFTAWIRALTVPLTYGTIALEIAWLLMLTPRSFWDRLYTGLSGYLRRSLIAGSILFHGGIFVTMLVGSFSPAMMTFLAGLWMGEDWTWLKRQLNRRQRGQIAVLYDGDCTLCQRSMFWLQVMDWLGRLKPINFRQPAEKALVAADLALTDLDNAMHIRFTAGKKRGVTFRGFDAFRALTWHLPVLWPAATLFYLPGVPWLGRRVYAWIAKHRPKCRDGACLMDEKQ